MPDAHGAEADVGVGEADPEEGHPSEEHVAAVEATDAVVGFFAGAQFGDAVFAAADQVAEGVAAEGVAAEKDGVDRENEGADADAEGPGDVLGRARSDEGWVCGGRGIGGDEEVGLDGVEGEEADEDDRDVEEVAVDVLEDERELLLAAVLFFAETGLADGAA